MALAEPFELERDDVGPPAQRVELCGRVLRAIGGQHERRPGGEPPRGQRAQEAECQLVGPLQIVDEQHERLLGRERRDRLGQAHQDVLPSVAPREHRGRRVLLLAGQPAQARLEDG